MLEKILENDQVQIVLIGLISGFLAIVGKLIIAGLNSIKNYIDSKIENENYKKVTGKVFEKINAFVVDSYKNASEDLKEKIKDGKLTAEEKAEWKNNIINHIKENSDSELKHLKLVGKDLENTVKFYAELAFADMKKKLF